MSDVNKKIKSTAKNIGGSHGTIGGDLYTEKVQKSIDEAIKALTDEANVRQNIDEKFLKGWLAEQWHAKTLETNAVARGNDDIWANVSGSNRTGEDIIYGNSHVTKTAEVKYNKNPMETAKGISRPEYSISEKVVPGDQIDLISKVATERAGKIESFKPDDAKQLIDTSSRAKDHIEVDGVTSKPLANSEAKEMAQDFKNDNKIDADKYNLNTESFVKWSDIARESAEAALTAAALSAALSAAPHVWASLKEYIETGKIDVDDFLDRGVSIMESSAAAGFRGGVAAAITAACKSGLMGMRLKTISPAAIGIATTMTINVIGYSLKMRKGIISKQEFANSCLKDSYVLSLSLGGAALGQIIIPIPILGALIGNIVGATLGAFAYEGVNNIILGISIENGWTFFGLVEQNYSVPEHVLKQCGYETISMDYFQYNEFCIEDFFIEDFSITSLEFTPLRRGVISSNIIGYL